MICQCRACQRQEETVKRLAVEMTFLVLGKPGVPEALIFLGVVRGEFHILSERGLRQLEHALVEKVSFVVQRRKHGEDIGRGDTCRGHLAGQENTLTERCVSANVKEFVCLGVGTSSYVQNGHQKTFKVIKKMRV